MTRTWIVTLCLTVMLSRTAAAVSPGPVEAPTGPWREQIHWVPMTDASGQSHLLYTRVCRPPRDTQPRIVLINHGAPPDANVRPTMMPLRCESEAAQWFLARGFLVVAGMRRGYGMTGGAYVESSGTGCSAEGYAASGRESARDVDAWVTYATALPDARKDGVVVIGQSAGGWTADAYDSVPHPKVIALVSMAGGRGGHLHNVPNLICRPEELIRAAGMFGATATTPMLWVYTANDSFFAPDVAAAMYNAFARAGGKADFFPVGPFGSDGHGLFFGRGGSAVWGPLMERYLAARGALP